MSNETIARRYSLALADVVAATPDADRIKAELANWGDLLTSNEQVKTVFGNPSIPHLGKEKVLEGLLAKTKPSKTTANFLRVLLRNGRLGDLAEINDRFAAVLEERSGVVTANITSARELPSTERKEFERNLEKVTGKKVKIEFQIDQEIIGGVITRIGSTVYDGSVRTKLENLREQLVNG